MVKTKKVNYLHLIKNSRTIFIDLWFVFYLMKLLTNKDELASPLLSTVFHLMLIKTQWCNTWNAYCNTYWSEKLYWYKKTSAVQRNVLVRCFVLFFYYKWYFTILKFMRCQQWHSRLVRLTFSLEYPHRNSLNFACSI